MTADKLQAAELRVAAAHARFLEARAELTAANAALKKVLTGPAREKRQQQEKRRQEIFGQWLEGARLVDIGRALGLSSCRVQGIVDRELRTFLRSQIDLSLDDLDIWWNRQQEAIAAIKEQRRERMREQAA